MGEWVRNWDKDKNKVKVEKVVKATVEVEKMEKAVDDGEIPAQRDSNKAVLQYSLGGDNDDGESLRRGESRRNINHNSITFTTSPGFTATTPTFTEASSSFSAGPKAGWKRKLRKGILMKGTTSKSKNSNKSTTTTFTTENYDNAINSTSGDDSGGNGNWRGLVVEESGPLLKWNFITTQTTTPETASTFPSESTKSIMKSKSRRRMTSKKEEVKSLPVQQLPLLARSVRTTVTVTTPNGGVGRGKDGVKVGEEDRGGIIITREKRRLNTGSSSSRFSLPTEFSVASAGAGLMEAAAPGRANGGTLLEGNGGIGGKNLGLGDNKNYIVESSGGDDHVVDVGVSRRLLDIHQISTRLHRAFPWEGMGLHYNNSTVSAGSIGHSITDRIGFNPATTPHTLMFSSLYIVPVILLLGVLVAIHWLVCACAFHTMKRLKIALCPGRSNSSSGSNSKKGKSSNNSGGDGSRAFEVDKKPQILTPEMLEMRRQERLAFLQAECQNLEQQLTGLRLSLASPQSTFEEKSTTLTSRASDSDLEYLGVSEESPPLKRNSISLQDIPQSVIRIRREKELRQIKEEIEYLKSIAQQEKEKSAQLAKHLKGSLLITQEFELPVSKPGSPSDTKVEPLSQHISHLKTQRKLNEIRSELEDLAIQLLHADEIKAKRSSLQDLPRTALNIQREQNLITMTNEIQKIKNYKLQKRNVIETALEKTSVNPSKGASGGGGGKQSGGSKSFNLNAKSPSTTEEVAAKYSEEFVRGASIRRQREQELNRVRVELKDLAYKLNLNPMNYISEDRVRLVPSQSMQSTSSITGQSTSYNKSTSSSSALNHV